MKTVLVTGGAGFIGSNFIKYFLRRNKNFLVINIDKLNYSSNIDNLKELEESPRHQFIKGDICNQDLITFVFKKYKPDYIINFAAENHNDRSINNNILSGESNILGTLTLLDAARSIWYRNKYAGNKFIQISTDEVYGSLRNSNDSFFEDSPLNPPDPFSASKAAADMLCQSYYKAYGMPVIITRGCNTYGPGQYENAFIPGCIKSAAENKSIHIYGDPSRYNEWIYVTDYVIAVIRTLFYGKPGEIYNTGTDEGITNIELARKILFLLNKSEDLIEKPKPRQGTDVPYRCVLNSYKIRNNLGWSHKMSLDEGLKDIIMRLKL
jgi:dTDP-D-glucose 4,6-dehydratase